MSLDFLKFGIFEDFTHKIRHGVSMRDGGVSKGVFESLNLGLKVGDNEENVKENFKRFCDAVGVDMLGLVVAYQEHTDKIMSIKEPGKGFTDLIFGVDGFVTDLKGIPLMVRFADCQGVLMYDPVREVIAAVHSGWRGNTKNIIGKAVKMMKTEYFCNPVDILAGISQSLGPCCAEFSDPYNELPDFMHKYVSNDKVDLWQCSKDQLEAEGVPAENIEIMERCTLCENDKFFSFRGGKGKTGHMGAVIELV